MGMTVEFYSADPHALATIFAADMDGEEEHVERFFEQLEVFPRADFAFHLQLPEDVDSLCRLLSEQDRRIPPVFRDLLVEQVWDDGSVVTESLMTLADIFVESLAELREQAIEDVARAWTATFPSQELCWQTPAYRAVWQLHAVARDAITRKRSLLLHLFGHPLF